MTSYSELEEEEDEGSDRLEKSPKVADKTLTTLEALPSRTDWRKIFVCPTRRANMLLLLCNTQNVMLTKSRMQEDQQKALFSVPLVTQQSLSPTMTYYWDPSLTIILYL